MKLNKVSKEGVDMTQAGIYSVHAKEAQQAADVMQEVFDTMLTEGKSLSLGDPIVTQFNRLIDEKRFEARNLYNKAKKIRDEYSK
jgi:purine-nucleoside phosphorylase